MANVAGVAGKSTEQSTVTIHDDETEGLVRLEQLTQGLGVELVVAKVERTDESVSRGMCEIDGGRTC